VCGWKARGGKKIGNLEEGGKKDWRGGRGGGWRTNEQPCRHGKEGQRDFGGERVVNVVKKQGREENWRTTYHLTEPVEISMVENGGIDGQEYETVGTTQKVGG
jgi:hypothetical protein